MAVRVFAKDSQYFSLASVLDYNSPYSAFGWVRAMSAPANPAIISLFNTDQLNVDRLRWDTGLNRFAARNIIASAGTNAIGTLVPAFDRWYCVGITRSAVNSFRLFEGISPSAYANVATIAPDMTGRTAGNATRFGANVNGTEFFDGDFYGWKLYQDELTLAEQQTELAYGGVQDATNLWASYPFETDATDFGPSSRHLTLSAGSLIVVPSPVPFGPPSAVASGTFTDPTSKADMVAGGKVLTTTLLNDKFIPQ